MAFEDLNQAIEALEGKGELIRVKEEVLAELEISAITLEVAKNKGPALLFENVKGHSIPVLTNLFGSRGRIQILFGADLEKIPGVIEGLLNERPPKGVLEKLRLAKRLIGLKKILPRTIKNPPCQEILLEEVDLSRLPILKSWEKDMGPFITAPMVITKDPLSGRPNMGMYRMQVFGKDLTGMHWHLHKGGAAHLKRARELKRPLEVAVAIGPDPITCYAATAPLLEDMDELMLSGLLRGRPVEMARCISVDLEVPAHSQIVLEGYVDPLEEIEEGPFGDHTGFYSPREPYPVFHVRLITMRKSPIYHAIVVGNPVLEDTYLGKLTERLFLPLIKKQLPEVMDINLPPEGVFHNICLVSIDKRYPGHAQKVMHAIWGMGQLMFTKMIFVFDRDVDVHDMGQVLFYLGANVDPIRDLTLTKGPLDALDHATDLPGLGGKLGFDCTKKWPGEGIKRPWPEPIGVPGHVRERISLILRAINR